MFFSTLFYGLKSVSEVSSFLVFLSIFLILFVVGFFITIDVLGLGAFLGKIVYSPSLYTVIAGELSFILSALFIIFTLCVLFYYKSHYIVSNDLEFKDLIIQSLRRFPKFIIAVFMQVFVSIIGLIAFVIPGVYYGSSLMFFGFFCTYRNYTISTAFINSRSLSKKVRLNSILSFLVYLIILFVFVYLISVLGVSMLYKGLIGSILLAYWAVSYSNTIFNLADKSYTMSEKHKYYT